MALDRSQPFDPGLSFIATLPLKALPRFSPVELLVAVNDIVGDSGFLAELVPALTTFEEEPLELRIWHRPKAPPRVGLTLNGVNVSVQGRDRPAFTADELAALDDSGWADGRDRVARARAHLEITEAGATGGSDLDHNYDRAAAVTVVAQAAARLTQPAAIVWHRSHRAMPVEQLAPLMAALAAGQAPVPLWLGRQVRRDAADGQLATCGLYPLLGAEIEVVARELPQAAAFDLAFALAAEILRGGMPPAHDTRLDYDRETQIHIRHRLPSEPGEVPALVLSHVVREVEPQVVAGAA